MNVVQGCNQLKNEVDRFMNWWINKHVEEPEKYPMISSMQEDEWLEQFLIFRSTVEWSSYTGMNGS